MRDDSILYTGVTSASLKIADAKKERREVKDSQKAQLTPSAELILSEIKKERNLIASEIVNIIHIDMTEEAVKSSVLGLRLADARMLSLQNRLLNILRGSKKESGNAKD